MTRDYEKQRFGDEFLDSIVEWIGIHLEVEDVFDKDILNGWAEANGFIKETDERSRSV